MLKTCLSKLHSLCYFMIARYMYYIYIYIYVLYIYIYIYICIIYIYIYINFMAPFYGLGSTPSRLQSHHEEIVYFLPLSFQIFQVLIRSILDGWKIKITLKSPSGFELVYQPIYYQIEIRVTICQTYSFMALN